MHTFRHWRDGLVAKCSYHSSRGPEFSFQHPHQPAHNCLYLQLQGFSAPFWVSKGPALTCVLSHVHHSYPTVQSKGPHSDREETQVSKNTQEGGCSPAGQTPNHTAPCLASGPPNDIISSLVGLSYQLRCLWHMLPCY